MAFTRWDPLRDLLALHEQIGQLVGTDAPGWTPPVDLYETRRRASSSPPNCPASSRDDIDIHAEDEPHRRSAAHAPPRHVPCEQYHRVERGHGRFSRAFVLPEPIDVEAIAADLKDGVLTVTIPKAGGRRQRAASRSADVRHSAEDAPRPTSRIVLAIV